MGRERVVSAQIATVWGTAVAPAANNEVILKNLDPLLNPRTVSLDQAIGYVWPEYQDLTDEQVNPELVMDLRWSGRLWTFIAQCMGLDTKTGAGDPYTHTLTLIDEIHSLTNFFTLSAAVGAAGSRLIAEWPSLQPTGFTIRGPVDGFVELAVRTIGDTVKLGADATAADADFTNVTHIALGSALPKRVKFGAASFKMNAFGGGAVTSESDLEISSFEFSFDRAMEPDMVARGDIDLAGQSAQPRESGMPSTMLKIEFPDMDALTYLEAYQDQGAYKAQLKLALDANHDITLEIPNMVQSVPAAGMQGASKIGQALTYNILKSQSNPTGMAFALPRIVLRDAYATAYE